MQVDSYLQLATTLYGWYLYDRFWFEILVPSGLVYLPFLVLLWQGWWEPARSQEERPAVAVSLRRVEMDFWVAVIVLLLAVVPLWRFEAHQVTYATPDGRSFDGSQAAHRIGPVQVDGGGMGRPSSVTVPLIPAVVMAVSNGLNASTRHLMRTFYAREVMRQTQFLQIRDPELLYETQRFNSECYMRATAKLQQGAGPNLTQKIHEYGEDDVGWMGSRSFLTTPGYYAKCEVSSPYPTGDGPWQQSCGAGLQAQRGVRGWTWEAERDRIYPDEPPQEYGRPYCSEWWEGDAGIVGL